MGIAKGCGRTLKSSAVVRYQQRFRRTEFSWAFNSYLVLSNLYWAAVTGRTSNEFHTCSYTCLLAATFMKHSITIISLVVLTILATLTSCRKEVPLGTKVTATGIVLDSVKNKVLANAKLYLFGAHQTFYGIGYSEGPLDSTVSDNNGKFSINFNADGKSIDYGLQLGVLEYGGYVYNNQTNYVIDYTQPLFKFNYSTNISNAVVRGRELNFTKIRLKVLVNPFDTFLVRTDVLVRIATLIKGQSIDTTIIVRHLPNQQNVIQYYTESLRDTVGLAALNSNPNVHLYSVRRMLADTINAGMSDTLYLNKTIQNSFTMPRQ